tara:strand:+ start:155 stop:670 length:516 start_codon:yes stop_codon:yes gene_type:complete
MSKKKDTDEILRYDKMVESALRGVVRKAVEEVRDNGLPDDHHFYITFLTEHKGVDIPDYLKERYPQEMTIVLQYQFYDLTVDDEFLSVTLSFNNIPERLVIPMPAITIFADPSVNFALQFQPLSNDQSGPDGDGDGPKGGGDDDDKPSKDSGDDGEETGQVISLDQFRKKD